MHRPLKLVPYVLFIISGGCGLVYEVTWARYLALFLGHTTLAHMCVLVAYMGGLALGSILIGRMSAGFRRPLAVYGMLELVIGLYALASPGIIGGVQRIALSAGSGFPAGSSAWLALKLLVSVVVLLLPTVLMGGTFPVLMRYFQSQNPSSEDKSEWLYLVNCGGAVAGTLLAGFMFIPEYGLQFTLLGIGAMNAALGVCAVALASMDQAIKAARKSDDDNATKTGRHPLATPVYAAIAVSGLASMIYELVWIKIFAVTLGSSTYSFTLMLSAFITGISLGSLAVGVIPRLRRKPVLSFALAEIAIALAVVLTIPMYERMPYIFWKWTSLLSRTPEAFQLFNILKYSLCFVVMAMPTFFFGMTLPLAIKAVARRNAQVGRDSGFVYGANTAGTLIGSLLTGLVLIRFVGLRHSLEIAIVINALAGAVLLLASDFVHRRTVTATAFVAILGLVLLMPKWHPLSLVMGTFRSTLSAPPTWREFLAGRTDLKLHFYREDDDGTVAVSESQTTRGLSLFINGKADASSYGDLCTQILLGQIPIFLRPDARDVLVVGLGSGISANSVLTHPNTHVDCVEISPAVVEASKCFGEHNGRVHQNKRFNLVLEDARTYVSSTHKKYDIVSSEPTNPWIAGVGNLFSQEYYQSVDRILKPGGIMAQWVQRYETSDDLLRTIMSTILTVFPYVYVFDAQPDDYIVIATREPLIPDFAAMQKRIERPSVKNELERISIDSLIAVLGRQLATPNSVSNIIGENDRINSDDLPVLEFQAPKAQFLGQSCRQLDVADVRLTRGSDLFVAKYMGNKPLSRREARSLIRSYADPRVGNARLAFALAEYCIPKWPDDPWVQWIYASLVRDMDGSAAARAALGVNAKALGPQALDMQAEAVASDLIGANTTFTPQDFTPALRLLGQAIEKSPSNHRLRILQDQVITTMR